MLVRKSASSYTVPACICLLLIFPPMTKHELINHIATKIGVTKKMATEMMDTLVESITTELKKGKNVTITGFGTFKITKRKARKGVNPQKPTERISIPAMKLPSFRAGKTFKDSVR